MRILSERMVTVLVVGMMSSLVLLSAESRPPTLSVTQLWNMGEDAKVSVFGLLVSLWAYESGTEALVISDESGTATVKVMCSPGPGSAPSRIAGVGDLLLVSGDCAFEGGTPVLFSRFCDVRVQLPSEEVLTVAILSAAWQLYEGDDIILAGVSTQDGTGGFRLHDADGECSIAMRLGEGVPIADGAVLVECILVLDKVTMTLLLDVSAMAPAD